MLRDVAPLFAAHDEFTKPGESTDINRTPVKINYKGMINDVTQRVRDD